MADADLDIDPDEESIELGFEDDIESAYRRALNVIDEADLGTSPDAAEPEADETAPQVPQSAPRVQARQVIEAALFVGGIDLTLKRLRELLGDEYSAESIERMVAEIDERYRNEGRPYEITFGEGGYRFTLRSEFEAVRARVFGLGPRDVRLTPETLEVLSLVAYRQPVTREDIEGMRDGNAGPILNNLVRRGLLHVERSKESKQPATYATTDRFLEVFGLADLDDMPQIENLRFK
ncbi:SMC-Scp complex subunit ScpB [Stratiformator vulcanicus]|nr:SMC-Scp complex subunit ScpB [Stratiformator vulcanicus]